MRGARRRILAIASAASRRQRGARVVPTVKPMPSIAKCPETGASPACVCKAARARGCEPKNTRLP
eukprot:10609868-Alexandrium_andersonii.AAC.1